MEKRNAFNKSSSTFQLFQIDVAFAVYGRKHTHRHTHTHTHTKEHGLITVSFRTTPLIEILVVNEKVQKLSREISYGWFGS